MSAHLRFSVRHHHALDFIRLDPYADGILNWNRMDRCKEPGKRFCGGRTLKIA